MRRPQFLSPTSISLFYSSVNDYYMKYLSDNRPPKIAQTPPMAAGSAFDAYVKSYLYERIFGKVDPQFELSALFETQVEPQNRDRGYEVGKHIFDEYKRNGCLVDLMADIQAGVSEPRFEFELRGVVNGHKEGVTKQMQEVVLLGKPDLFYRNKEGASVIHDWKVNGYYSNWNISPMPGCVRLRVDGMDKGPHKDAWVMMKRGMKINVAHFLEKLDEDWARQLCIYSWLCGEEVGADFICSVDQVVCKKGPIRPTLRFAEHRLRVTPDWQWETFAKAQHVWEVVNSDHIFRDRSIEESKKRCQALDLTIDGMKVEPGNTMDKWFMDAARS